MFSKRLVYFRDKVGLTQEELSKRLGMARTTYQGYENGKREPDLNTLEKIAKFYDITVDDLLGREKKDAVDRLIEYLDLELTDEQIIEHMNFKVDNLTLSNEEVREFIAFVRAKRFMKSGQQASSLKFEGP
ncbi:MAG: Xre family transcriptional regulator [Bacilli bacterium]|nr:Xre family transcriptional regulator [Bacilli bacterium]